MKHIATLLLALTVVTFASCSHHRDATTHTTDTTTTTGYSK